MTISINDFRTRFPEFADDTEYPDARIQLFIEDSALIYMGEDENRWCGKYDVAQAYLTAHLLTVATWSEVGDVNSKLGVVTSKSAGGVSVGRAYTGSPGSSDDDEWFKSTSYGMRYLSIRNSCFVGVLVVT